MKLQSKTESFIYSYAENFKVSWFFKLYFKDEHFNGTIVKNTFLKLMLCKLDCIPRLKISNLQVSLSVFFLR